MVGAEVDAHLAGLRPPPSPQAWINSKSFHGAILRSCTPNDRFPVSWLIYTAINTTTDLDNMHAVDDCSQSRRKF